MYGCTEWLKNTLNPQFATTIEMDYFFEEVQELKFSVYNVNDSSSLEDNDFLGSIECTLSEVSIIAGKIEVCLIAYFT